MDSIWFWNAWRHHMFCFQSGESKMVSAMGVHMGPEMPEVPLIYSSMVAMIMHWWSREDIVTTDSQIGMHYLAFEAGWRLGKLASTEHNSDDCVGSKGVSAGSCMSSIGDGIHVKVKDGLGSCYDSQSAWVNLSKFHNTAMAPLKETMSESSLGAVRWNDEPHNCPSVSFGRWVWSQLHVLMPCSVFVGSMKWQGQASVSYLCGPGW